MRVKFLFLITLLLPISLFSYEINFHKRFTKLVTPDLLSTFVNFKVENESEEFINKHIEKFNNYIKNNTSVEKKDGKFTISPKYKYFKNTQKFIGYVGTLRYVIRADNAKDMNKFINDLINLEDDIDGNNVKFKVSNVSWITSNGLYASSVDALRIDAIKWIDSYTKSLKKDISKNCHVKSIVIDKSSNQFLLINKKNASSKIIADIAPVSSSQEISIDPNFLLECK